MMTKTPKLPLHILKIERNKGRTLLHIDVTKGVGNGRFEKALPPGWTIIETRWKTAPTLEPHETGIERVVLLCSGGPDVEKRWAVARITQTPRSTSLSIWNWSLGRHEKLRREEVSVVLGGANYATVHVLSANETAAEWAKKLGYAHVTNWNDDEPSVRVPWVPYRQHAKYPPVPMSKTIKIGRKPNSELVKLITNANLKKVGEAVRAMLLPVAKKVGMTVGPCSAVGQFSILAKNHLEAGRCAASLSYLPSEGTVFIDMRDEPSLVTAAMGSITDSIDEELNGMHGPMQFAGQLGNLHEALVRYNESAIEYLKSQRAAKAEARKATNKVRGAAKPKAKGSKRATP